MFVTLMKEIRVQHNMVFISSNERPRSGIQVGTPQAARGYTVSKNLCLAKNRFHVHRFCKELIRVTTKGHKHNYANNRDERAHTNR